MRPEHLYAKGILKLADVPTVKPDGQGGQHAAQAGSDGQPLAQSIAHLYGLILTRIRGHQSAGKSPAMTEGKDLLDTVRRTVGACRENDGLFLSTNALRQYMELFADIRGS